MGHADFYVTAAAVIPVLYAILIFQTRALVPAPPGPNRGLLRAFLQLFAALAFVGFPLYAEGTAIYALYLNEDSHYSRLIALLAIQLLLSSLLGVVVAHVRGNKIL